MDLDENVLATFGLVTSSLVAIVANSLLLVVFCRRRGLRTISNRFVINLLFANVLSSILLLPIFILDSHLLASIPTFNISLSITNNFTTDLDTIIYSDTEIVHDSSRDITIVEETREEIIINHHPQLLEIVTTNPFRSQFETRDDILCFLSEFVVTFVITACVYSVLLIGVDQYFAVLHPLRYQSYINKVRSLVLVLLAWCLAALFGAGSALTDANVQYFRSCRNKQFVTTWTVGFAGFYLVAAIIVPFVMICDIYVCIYSAAHKNSAKVRKVTSMNFQISARPLTAGTLKKTHSAPNFSEYESTTTLAASPRLVNSPLYLPRSTTASSTKVCRTSSDRLTPITVTAPCRRDLLGSSRNLLGQLRHKMSNASVFRYREEGRTAKISLLVVFMVLLCYGPYGVSLLLNAFRASSTAVYRFNTISLILLLISNVISPFLFAYRNRRIQRELGKFLKIIPQNSLRRKQRSPLPNIVIQRNSEGNHFSVDNDNNVAKTFPNEAAEFGEVTAPFLVTKTCDNSNNISNSCSIINIETDAFEANAPVQKKSILKRVCSSKSWNYKKCSFITVPDSCLDARGSFSSASTQVSTEES